jgi:23S rRNA-/tRNA-specific pseudouridylate synthase
MLRERRLAKRYLALVDGEASAPGEWRDKIARDGQTMTSAVSAEGAEAYADMLPLVESGGRSLILVELHSGLTHQIRVQAASRGLPLSGDAKYGGSPFVGGYILHSLSIQFPAPPFPDLPSLVTAPLPEGARRRLEAQFGTEALRSAMESQGLGPACKA